MQISMCCNADNGRTFYCMCHAKPHNDEALLSEQQVQIWPRTWAFAGCTLHAQAIVPCIAGQPKRDVCSMRNCLLCPRKSIDTLDAMSPGSKTPYMLATPCKIRHAGSSHCTLQQMQCNAAQLQEDLEHAQEVAARNPILIRPLVVSLALTAEELRDTQVHLHD